jgi:hypothetical protein
MLHAAALLHAGSAGQAKCEAKCELGAKLSARTPALLTHMVPL